MERGAEALPSLGGGRYKCVAVLGEGSMGRTYLADADSGQQVAIKQLYPSRLATLKDLQLFMREADALRRMDHPQIPAYIDAFEEPDGAGGQCYFLVQQHMPGESLRAQLQRAQRFDEASCAKLGCALLEVLAYMHGLEPRVVHRDLKPENILIDPSSGAPSLVDFGAVREVVRLTMGGGSTIIGTYGYMPPEQLMGRALPASDLYALGIVMLECLTRRVPGDLSGRQAAQMIDALQVSDGLKRVLRRLCAPTLDERYASAVDALTDLRQISAGGALVHAQVLERTIEARKAEHARALARASAPLTGMHVGYVMAAGFILSSALLGSFFFISAIVTADLSAGFVIALICGGLGLVLNFIMLMMRYNQDMWDAPGQDWVHARGQVNKISELRNPDNGALTWEVHYSFPVRAQTFEQTLSVSSKPPASCLGQTVDVYYPPGHPQNSEVQDFIHEAIMAQRLAESRRRAGLAPRA